jgi:adenylyl-sulfate kinase
LAELLRERGIAVELLDGDEIRRALSADLGFGRAARETQARRVTYVASVLARHGVVPIVALISPYRSSRAEARSAIRNFVEVHVATPLDVCEERDRKGLYARARRGEIREFTGVDDPYEPPERAEVTLTTVGESPEESARRLLRELDALQVLPGGRTEEL